jgi:hypothetical protein
MSPRIPSSSDTVSRRAVLAAAGTVATTAVAGCGGVVNFVGDQFLDEVNLFNETDRRIAGSIAVAGPDDQSRLDETFELISSRTDTGDGQSFAAYGDVWDGAGSYEVSVELDETDVDGVSEAAETVEIDAPDEERLAVVIGAADLEDPLAFRVGENFADFAPTATTTPSS